MVLKLTEKQRQRWINHRLQNKRYSVGHDEIDSSWICENRDPHDVKTVLLSICRYGFSVFYYRHIRKYFNQVNGSKMVPRNKGVNALHALWVDGFISVEKRKDGNRARYTRLFPLDDWEDVYDRVIRQ